MSFSSIDHAMMAQALRLAERGAYTTKPNPMVGCVVAEGAEVLGEGWHHRKGEPHAEVFALREAGDRARGATAYVTLEPCAHTGSTGPCAEALIEAGGAARDDRHAVLDGCRQYHKKRRHRQGCAEVCPALLGMRGGMWRFLPHSGWNDIDGERCRRASS